MHSIVVNQNYTISIRLRTYSSFKAALTAGEALYTRYPIVAFGLQAASREQRYLAYKGRP